MDNDQIKLKSVAKAFKVLECFINKPSLGVTEISEMTELYKSNVHNILTTLKALEYVEQDSETDRYYLGIKILELSKSVGDRYSIRNIAIPYLQELSNITKEKVYLGVPNKDKVVYLEAFHPEGEIDMMRSLLGEQANMYCTGIGKAMLAYSSTKLVSQYLDKNLVKFTENTITDKDELLIELEETKKRGYAIDNMEHEYGIKCVAVPIFDERRQIHAAFSVSGPSLRFTDTRIIELAELMKKYALKIQSKISV